MTTLKSGWTHESVRLLAGTHDPLVVVTEKARELVMGALDKGWSGPPFDPVALATDYLKLHVVATDDVFEARTVAKGTTTRIEYNPNRPRERRRYSIAHEIAHTLFPDCARRVRHRGSNHSERPGTDDWQLEALCNIAAAEILIPVGSLPPISRSSLTVDGLASLRPKYDVSMEAVLIRAVHMADFPCAAFAAAHMDNKSRHGRYQIEYIMSSGDSRTGMSRELLKLSGSLVHDYATISDDSPSPNRASRARRAATSAGIS